MDKLFHLLYHKVWDEIPYPFQSSTAAQIKFGNGWVISCDTLLCMCLYIYAGVTVNPY